MQHEIDREKSPALLGMARAIEGCVHCGFCLPACPTYAELGEEMDSPRGRIVLMKEVLEGTLSAESARPFIDRCLGCLACEPACPSGVPYGELLHPFRASVRPRLGIVTRLWSAILHRILARPGLFRAVLWSARPLALLRGVLPKALAAPLEIASVVKIPRHRRRALRVAGPAAPRGRLGLLAGCAQEVLRPQINDAALRVLSHLGFEVEVPEEQACCGALAMHDGLDSLALELGRANLAAFGGRYDRIVTTAAGCGSGMKEYPKLFKEQDLEGSRVREFAAQVVDVSSLVESVEIEFPAGQPATRVAYQGACHLENAQGVIAEPRRLLQRIPGVELVELSGGYCCGSAGTYNLQQPELAGRLGEAKAQAIIDSGARRVVTGNIGCLIQMQVHLRRLGRSDIEVLHTIELIDRALFETTL